MAERHRKPARRRADPARLAAYEVLEAVRADDAYTNLVLPAVLRRHGLTGRDAAFATELAAGTLRRRGSYDAVLAACVDRPLARVEPGVLDALRLGTHQLLSMRVPPHAAISTTVDLVHDKVGRGPAGFTNAVLRKTAQHDLSGWV
ncbi:MAG TPA: transcription antitermination factor NusB, partial [Nocardioides sp.]|nr:transcription antitermination factor NusB [Nocardioides sp.]